MTIKNTNLTNPTLLSETMVVRNRGVGLTLSILAVIGYSAFRGIIFTYLVFLEGLQLRDVVLGLLYLANIIFGVAIWKWKKWGVYGVIAVLLVWAGIDFGLSEYGWAIFNIIFFPGLLMIFTRDEWKPDKGLAKETEVGRDRGLGLTLVILAIIVLGIYEGIENIYEGFIGYRQLNALIYGLIALGKIFFGVAMWKWKKWGVYGVIACALVISGFYLAYQDFVIEIIIRIVEFGILAFVLRDRWKYFG